MRIIYFYANLIFTLLNWLLVVSINLLQNKFIKCIFFLLNISTLFVCFFYFIDFDLFSLHLTKFVISWNTNNLFFLPFYDQNYLWSIAKILADIMVDNMYLADDPIWIKSLEISLIIELLRTSFLTYSDCVLLINELTNLNSLPGANYFINKKLFQVLLPEDNLIYYEGLKKFNRIVELYPTLDLKEPKKPQLYDISNEENSNILTEKIIYNFLFKDRYAQKCEEFKANTIISNANLLTQKDFFEKNLKEFYIIFLYNQLTFLNLVILFLRKKIFIFMFINLSLFILMLWNLYKLATASNLIYSLIHFLFFAILSGLIALFWGSTYIGFCILLIYGAAIPVLALYIIMLVNVDLIQRLFFVEHQENKSFFSLLVRSSTFLIILMLLLTTLVDNLILTQSAPQFNIYTILFYFILAKRYIKFLEISYTNESIYDLNTNFYYSDIDKVASAAFYFSTNELIALVLLLLIAIVVVIGISRGGNKIDKDFYEENFMDLHVSQHLWTENMLENFSLIYREQNLVKFFLKKEKWRFIPLYQNSNDLHVYSQVWESALVHLDTNEKQSQINTKYFITTPYDYWYTSYDSERLTKFLIKNNEFLHPFPYGLQNNHPDDYYFYVLNYGLVE